ncbi:cobalamin-binding protein [Candidatus Pacearchaeota archaeon CG10_big_fil_rev_8_21_14_0_10_31_24]|nr:MAG: cobalamin-binding protein [Candidatus Pacearchaeota archaeon CG10_big_fil_rev_8_21_14_0_10_31_24]
MGLLRIGTAAKRAGYQVKILDSVYEGWDNEKTLFCTSNQSTMFSYGLSLNEITERVRQFNPHIVGVTCSYTHQWGNAREVSDRVKSLDEKIVTITGGVHVTGLPKDALLDSPTDYVVLRQADVSFVELLDSLTKKEGAKKLEEIAGIGFKKEGTIRFTSSRSFAKDIDQISIPDLSLINLSLYNKPYHSAGKRNRLDGNLIYGFTSIGCNTGCNFCAIPSSQGGFRKMSEINLDNYLEYIKSQGVTEFLLEDDHLLHDLPWARHVFRKLKEYDLAWFEEGGMGLFNLISLLPEVKEDFIRDSARNQKSVFQSAFSGRKAELTTEKLISEMAESGCYGGYLAVESANESSLGNSNKPTLNSQEEHTKRIVGMFNQKGMDITCGLMLGFINPLSHGQFYVESQEQIRKSIFYGQKLKKSGAAFINPFIVTPLPGAPNFPLLEKRLGHYMSHDTDEGFSHEFATMSAPNDSWTRDEMNLLREHALLVGNGLESYRLMKQTGTWPVGDRN